MKRLAHGIVAKRNLCLLTVLLLSVVCGILSLRVPINSDMTKYLPDDSPMKQGIDILKENFSGLSVASTIRAMAENLGEEEAGRALAALREIPNVSSAAHSGHKEEAGKIYDLFTLSTKFNYRSPEELAIEKSIPEAFAEGTAVTVRNDDTNGMAIPFFIFIVAGIFLLAVLFSMCGSFVEPFLFLAAIGFAVLINMGTNIFLGSVSQVTYSIAAVLQLVLSMDYSVILMNRYRQEKAVWAENSKAMEHAMVRAFPSVASSGFTTFVGLLMLVFMRFKIGKDVGLVLAKGVLLSMLCVFVALPGLILLFDKAVERTKKPSLHIPTAALASFSYRFRRVLAVGFILLFFGSWYLEGLAGTSYSLSQKDPIADIFPKENQIVLVCENGHEAEVAALLARYEEDPRVRSVLSYATTIGKQMTAEELSEFIRSMADNQGAFAAYLPEDLAESFDQDSKEQLLAKVNPETLNTLYAVYGVMNGTPGLKTLSIEELFSWLTTQTKNPLVGSLLGKEGKDAIEEMGGFLDMAKAQMVGEKYSLVMLSTDLPVEGEETISFLQEMKTELLEAGVEHYYLIGNSPMNLEMQQSFGREFLTISLLTAASIFLVVLVTFRQAVIPAVLVLLVQCGVFLTVSTTWLLGYKMYYLALLIVQCILMGATVDYGILFTNYYREMRWDRGIKEALKETYQRSIHTILTSALFMVIVTGAIGFSPIEPTIAQICLSISLGAASATILVIFILPGILAALDRFVVRKGAAAP